MRAPSLEGITVVDLTQVVSGAVTTMLLADFGAEVIKIEPPGGEAYRRFGLPLEGPGGSTNLNITRFSRGKKSVELNLKSEPGKEILAGLIEQADVLVENFRPGVLAKLGFSPERIHEINDELIYTTISGFGHDDVTNSPYRNRPAYAIITESMAGITHLAGDGEGPPVWLGFAMADVFAGTLALNGTLLALLDRAQTGQGRRVDIGMYDGALFMNDLAVANQSLTGETMGGGQYALQSPWGPFPATDGYVTIAVLNSKEWQALCRVLGRGDLAADEDLATGVQRSKAHEDRIRPAVEAWTSQRTRDEATQELLEGGVPAAPVNTAADIMDCPQARARQMLETVESPELGDIELVGNPIKLDGVSTRGGKPRLPSLGEHTEEVLRKRLGASVEDISEWADEGAIGSLS